MFDSCVSRMFDVRCFANAVFIFKVTSRYAIDRKSEMMQTIQKIIDKYTLKDFYILLIKRLYIYC